GPSTGDPARDPEADGPSTGDPASDPEPDRPSTGDPARVEAPQAAPPRPAHRGDVAGNAPYRPEPQAMKTSKKLRLILNDPSGRKAPYDRCDVELCRSIVGLIDGSKKTIDFALYGMRNQSQIFDALMRARKRGVRIRGIVDRTLDGKNYYSSTEKLVAALGTVRDDLESEKRAAREQTDKMDPFAGHKPLCPRPVGFEGPLQCLAYDLGDQCLLAAHASREPLDGSGAIMHDKFFVVDGRFVWTGSTNASDSGTGGYNANLVTVIDAPKVADLFTLEFEQMWARGLYHNYKEPFDGPWSVQLDDQTRVEVLFSPQHKPITRSVRKLIQRAGWKIDIAVFFLTHKGITEDLIKAHRRGVEVRVILDATAAKNGYSKHELLRAAGIPLKIEHWGGKMHMKSAVIDEEVVITGSMNWTSAGEGGNDEN
ncbi:MAG: DUF1669 domain-containing protein, partial [Myxococcales bacterium]|nr:DUF1669 domain-containing protein [Myxococcales bacterium]